MGNKKLQLLTQFWETQRIVPHQQSSAKQTVAGAVSVQVARSPQKTVQKPKVATLVKKLGSGVSVDLYMIVSSVSLLHISSMVNHNSQQCQEHKKNPHPVAPC